jgi:hypothetical protein
MSRRQRRRNFQRTLEHKFWETNNDFLSEVLSAPTFPSEADKCTVDEKARIYLLKMGVLLAAGLWFS